MTAGMAGGGHPYGNEYESVRTVHGGDIQSAAKKTGIAAEKILDFSANINPLGIRPAVREAYLSAIEEVGDYPDPYCRRLRGSISEASGHPAEWILCGNGGADLIYRLVYAVRPKRALITAPTFSEYERALDFAGAKTDIYRASKDFTVDEGFAEAVEDGHDLVFLCNPNNPTGLLTGRDAVIRLLERAAGCGARVCVDECFMDFVSEREDCTAEGLLGEYRNLIILKSFTKLYALPGLRLGYVLCSDKSLLTEMSLAGQPWSVSAPAQAAGCAAMRDASLGEETCRFVSVQREYLKEGFLRLGFEVLDGRANYLCFRAADDPALGERLLYNEGILIRSCADYRGMGADYYRTAVRTEEENGRLLAALKRCRTAD